jgi:hypothetical protein
VRYDVGGCDDVNVVATALLKAEHCFGELAMVDELTVATVVDLPVLTKATQEVAVGEEDRSRTSLAD